MIRRFILKLLFIVINAYSLLNKSNQTSTKRLFEVKKLIDSGNNEIEFFTKNIMLDEKISCDSIIRLNKLRQRVNFNTLRLDFIHLKVVINNVIYGMLLSFYISIMRTFHNEFKLYNNIESRTPREFELFLYESTLDCGKKI